MHRNPARLACRTSSSGGPAGFTLVELMVVVAIAAILMALALPSFTAMINRNRLVSHANELVASLQIARMEAVKQNRRAVVCPSTDGSTCAGAGQWSGWITALDTNGNNAFEASEVIRTNLVKAPVRVTSGSASIVFRGDGMARNATTGALLDNTITVCIPTTQPLENQRRVQLGSGSRISTESSSGAAGACP